MLCFEVTGHRCAENATCFFSVAPMSEGLAACVWDNWFPRCSEGQTHYPHPENCLWTSLHLSVCLLRERWMWGWSIQCVLQIIQRGEDLHQTIKHHIIYIYGFSLTKTKAKKPEGVGKKPSEWSPLGFSTSAAAFLHTGNILDQYILVLYFFCCVLTYMWQIYNSCYFMSVALILLSRLVQN